MFKIFEEVKLLRKELNDLKKELNDLKSDMAHQNNDILEMCKKVDSRAYYEMVGKYETKEKRLYKKAVEIIVSGEKPSVDYFAGRSVVALGNGVCGTTWNTKIDYKDLHFLKNRRGLVVMYKDFTFNDKNSSLLLDLHNSLHKPFE